MPSSIVSVLNRKIWHVNNRLTVHILTMRVNNGCLITDRNCLCFMSNCAYPRFLVGLCCSSCTFFVFCFVCLCHVSCTCVPNVAGFFWIVHSEFPLWFSLTFGYQMNVRNSDKLRIMLWTFDERNWLKESMAVLQLEKNLHKPG